MRKDKLLTHEYASNKKDEIKLKCIIIGDSGVGKSCILTQLTEGMFDEHHQVTVGVEFGIYEYQTRRHVLRLEIWDTCGQERYSSISRTYYRQADIVIIVYSITDSRSFDNLSSWLLEARDNTPSDCIFLLCANKVDEEHLRCISIKDGLDFQIRHTIHAFYECSAKTSHNIKDLFEYGIQILDRSIDTRSREKKGYKEIEYTSVRIKGHGSSCCL